MNTLPYLVCLFVVCSSVSRGVAADSRPGSSRTSWRIPEADGVPQGIDWLLVRHPDDERGPGHINLEAAIGEHHSYEFAWAYYTKLLGLDPVYPPKKERQVRAVPGGHRHFAKESVNAKGRFTIMGGRIGKYKLTMYLWADAANPSKRRRVYVKMLFCP